MAFEGLKDRWENTTPSERRLLGLLGVTFVVCIFGFVGFQIVDGLDALENKNEATREALRKLDRHAHVQATKSAEPDPTAVIGDTAPPLNTYLEGIANELGMQIPESTERPSVQKGKFQERSIDIRLRGVSLDQLAQFLKRAETRHPAVVTQRLYIKPYVSAHEKLDVELTIATYERAKVAKPGAKPGAKGDGKGKVKEESSDDGSGG